MTTRGSESPRMSRRQRVGILGGGQLARMMALAGLPLGLQFKVLDPAADACAGECAPLLNAAFDDAAALQALAGEVDVVTFDFENVPADSARALAGKVPVFPAPDALAVAQDRLAEKTLFRELGIPVPAFAAVESREGLERALDEVGVPCILKTRRLGYDGKGQFRIRSHADADAAWEALGAQAARVGLILEAFVPFDGEVSVVAVRGRDGEFRAWPLTANWHVDGVLSASLAPAPVPARVQDTALRYARLLAEKLGYVGVFALELFSSGMRPANGAERAMRTASRRVAASKSSTRMRSQPASSASRSSSRVSTSTISGRSGRAARAAWIAAPTEPATRTWFSLSITASYRPMRWLPPPPARTAYFCAWRRPGRVLRVSRMVVPVPRTAST